MIFPPVMADDKSIAITLVERDSELAANPSHIASLY